MTRPGPTGILGGTFDPFHLGHLAVAGTARAALALDTVRIVPAAVPPHRHPPIVSSHHRFAMAALGISGEPGLLVDDIEVADDEPSYTIVTLRRLHALGFAPEQLFFITGADAFAEIATWKDYPRVLDGAHFVVISREGRPATSLPSLLPALAPRMRPVSRDGGPRPLAAELAIFLVDAPTPAVSSTAVRERARAGESLEGLVPPLVAGHIARHALYRTEASTSPAAGIMRAANELHEQESV